MYGNVRTVSYQQRNVFVEIHQNMHLKQKYWFLCIYMQKYKKVLKYANAYADMHLHIIRCLVITLLVIQITLVFLDVSQWFCNHMKQEVHALQSISGLLIHRVFRKYLLDI